MAAQLLLAGRVIAILEPSDMSTAERLERLLRHDPTGLTHPEAGAATSMSPSATTGRSYAPCRCPPGIDLDRAEARVTNSVLTIRFPKMATRPGTRRIPIHT